MAVSISGLSNRRSEAPSAGPLRSRTTRCAPRFSAAIEQVDTLPPADIQACWTIAGGHPYHGEMAMDQVLYLRPVPGWYDYRTPVAGLYLCGLGCHPGGGITGLPGRNAARRTLVDWKSYRNAGNEPPAASS